MKLIFQKTLINSPLPVAVVETPVTLVRSVGHRSRGFLFYILNSYKMNNSNESANALAQAQGAEEKKNALAVIQNINANFKSLIVKKIYLKDGREDYILTFLPTTMMMDDINAGLNKGLEYSGVVQSAEAEVFTLTSGNVKHFCKILRRYFK